MEIKKVTLPGEEGEWEPVGYEFQGEPGGDATVTVKEWPGMNNVRVYRRVEEKEAFTLKPFDAVTLKDMHQLIWNGETYLPPFDGIPLQHIGITIKGKRADFELSHVVEVWRNGERVWSIEK